MGRDRASDQFDVGPMAGVDEADLVVLAVEAAGERLVVEGEIVRANEVGIGGGALDVATVGHRTLGLLVEAVSDIINVTEDMVQPTPDVACDQVKTFVKGLFAIDGRMVSLISLDRVLPEIEAEAA